MYNRIPTASRTNASASLRVRRAWYDAQGKLDPAPPKAEKPYDKSACSYCETLAEDAYKNAQAILKDERYNNDFKRTEVQKLFDAATAEIQSRFDGQLTSLAADTEKAEKALRGEFLPSPDVLAQMNYVKDWLTSQKHVHDGMARVRERWATALKDGDKVTARAIRDYLPAIWQNREGEAMAVHSMYAKETDELLLSPEQRKASEKLAYNRETEMRLRMASGMAKSKLRGGWRVQPDGTIKDGAAVEMFERVRGGW